jgi:4-amino-4-deoxy-L-arabinose transferase-like glycosyltransferase
MPSNSRQFALLAGILVMAFGLRLFAAAWWEQRLAPPQRFGFPDSESYWQLAQRVARGEAYEFGPERYRVFRTPGYPVLLAGLFRLVGNDNPPTFYARILGALLGTITVAGVGWFAGLLFGSRAALLAAAIAAVHPEAIAPSVFLLSEAPFCPLMMLQLIAWTVAWQSGCTKRRAAWSLLGGVAAGLATLMRPSWLLFVPFALAIGLAFGPQRFKQAWIGGWMMAGLCLAMLPWWVRNYGVTGRFVPTSLQVGASLYDGLSPIADGSSNMVFVEPGVKELRQIDEQRIARGETLTGSFEERLDHYFRGRSVAWTRQHPARAVELAAIKFIRIWSPLPNTSDFKSRTLGLILAVCFVPLITAAIYGAWRFARRDWPNLLAILPAVYFTLLHMIFVGSIRYRQPALLPLMALAAAAVLYAIGRLPPLPDRSTSAVCPAESG